MGQPAAKLGDQIMAVDTHIIQPPGPVSPVPVPLPFVGFIDGECSSNVFINGLPAATLGSTATNVPPHIPPAGAFVNPPTNKATIISGSATVMINNKPAARAGDTALTCNDPAPLPVGTVVAVSTVLIGP
ncbi:MAG: PAAR domain-containing protein [Candidatus Eremiobacteraeota bacterium]|nr:PAAR domain-containing protein [Candidatus Eremiobacteraeota bacterium]